MTKYKIPTSVKNNAKQVLKWRSEYPSEIKGMTNVGWRRASQLANDEYVSDDIIKRMRSFLARHEGSYNAARNKAEYKTEPWKSAAIVAYLGWGGKSAKQWVNGLAKKEYNGELSMSEQDVNNEKNDIENDIEKSYDDEYDYVSVDSYLTPYGVTSFEELDVITKYQELQTAYEIALGQFIEMADRIIKGNYVYNTNENDSELNIKLNKLRNLTNEFLNRIELTYSKSLISKELAINLTKGNIVHWDYPGDSGYGEIVKINEKGKFNINNNEIIATKVNPVYEIELFSKAKDGTFTKSNEIKLKIASDIKKIENNDIIIKENLNDENNLNVLVETPTFKLIKSDEGLYWFGVPTNKYLDKDGEIIASYAHEEFVKSVNEGIEPFPELWIWHIKKAVGTTDFIDYDERGFVVAGGTIFKEYENLVEKIVTNAIAQGDVMGMSHQMVPGKTLLQGKTYIKYVSKEFSLLPVKHAANSLTGFTI